MDKRKSGEELDGNAAKRRKSDNAAETPESTRKVGLELLEILKKTTDKTGRIVSTHFLTLPNKRLYPDYYKVTKLPIALDTIHAKLQKGAFKNVTELESYFKRMIQNARDYNTRGSEVFEDAERLRKALSNLMREHNPAYKLIPNYAAVPTPLPLDDGEDSDDDGEEEEDEADAEDLHEPTQAARRKSGPPQKKSQALVQRSSATPSLSDFQYANVGFEGLTFQKAQEKIVEDMIREKEIETDEFAAFQPFLVLPSRTEYKDYYRIISHPVSLNSLQKKVKGATGRNAATGISEFKTWAAFEDEASYIWRNAYIYNEDGSDFYVLGKDLESFFKKRLAQAKAAVAEPVGPKIKLKLPDAPAPKITLKFGNKAAPAESPAPQPTPQPNGSNGKAAPVQLPHLTPLAPLAPLAPATNGGNNRQNPFRGSQSSGTPVPNLGQLERARSMSGSVSSPTPSNSTLVKNEEVARNSPIPTVPSNPRGPTNGVSTPGPTAAGMPPPLTPGAQNLFSHGGYAQSFNHQSQYQSPNPNPSFDSKWRQPGKTAADAMITNLSLATHPGLNISRHFRMDLPPSQTMAQQSITINLPSTHYYLQIKPTLAAATMERQHKLFVTSGNQRLHAMPTIPGHSVDQRHPLFEARLLPGVNRIEVELIAALPKGASRLPNGQDVELEKIIVFANLMRS